MYMRQTNLIYNTDWDVLIILDACRYDIFHEVYKETLGNLGSLKKVISPATHTMQWLNETFNEKKFDDVIYIAGNPFINSGNKPISSKGLSFEGNYCSN